MPNIEAHMQPFSSASASAPYPIAAACRRYIDAEFDDPWQEWEALSRGILTPVLQYLSHMLLSDLVATGEKPPRLFHRIQSILSRPLGGHYVGFLRETARLYRDEDLTSAVPELVDFVIRADVECTVLESGKPLLGLLVEYRNLWAHGKFDNPEALDETVATIRQLTAKLLKEIAFLERYPLKLEDSTELMGAEAAKTLSKDPQPFLVIQAGDVSLRPLLLKLKGRDLVLLEDFDLSGRLVFKGTESFEKFTKKQLKKGDGAKLFEELKALLQKVRAVDAVLELPDWDTFSERSAVVTERVIALYEDMNKYVPAWYVPRPEWHGPESIFNRFLGSGKSLLALSGVQGTGKSALVSHLAHEAMAADHAVLFINAQRFTFAEVEWTGNPYPTYFADLLHYKRPFDWDLFKRLLKTVPQGKQVVLFIDAINEVDGIEVKWNRFRAMELLLEWIAEIAQPTLKIVLSFRLDAYEDYDYLQPEEVPERISQIAFTDTDHQNPRKPWVVDLESFDAKQAELLYERLQKQPESGMAPAMTWHQILKGLGDNIVEFTSNPLLFMIFLRAHHQESEVLSSDRNELFQRYADKLTGAAEIKQWPWWKKVIGFIKNGNITPKEQLLADMVSKMTEEGSAAFIVERLGTGSVSGKRRKQDQRLLRHFQDLRDPTIPQLKDGGLISEEVIEVLKSGKDASPSRRVGFVAELMSTIFDAVSDRVAQVRQLRHTVFLLTFLNLSVVLFVNFLIFQGRRMGEGMGFVTGGKFEDAIIYLNFFVHFTRLITLTMMGFFSAAFLLRSMAKTPQPSTQELGLLQKSYLNGRDSEFTTRFGHVALVSVVPWFSVWIFLDYVLPDSVSEGHFHDSSVSIFLAAGLISQVIFLMIVFVPAVYFLIQTHLIKSALRTPTRVRVSASRNMVETLKKQRTYPLDQRFIASTATVVILMVGALVLQLMDAEPPQASCALSFPLMAMDHNTPLITDRADDLKNAAAIILLSISGFYAFLTLLSYPLGKFGSIGLHQRLAQDHNPKIPLGGFWKVVGVVQLAAIIGGSTAVLFLADPRRDLSAEDIAFDFRIPTSAIKVDLNARITGLDLSEASPGIRSLEGSGAPALRRLTDLHLPPTWPPVDVSQFRKLNTLAASPKSILGLPNSSVTELILDQPCDLKGPTSLRVTKIELKSECPGFIDFRENFPNLKKLTVRDKLHPAVKPEIVGAELNFLLAVESEEPPRLDWLSIELCRLAIIQLKYAPDEHTKNLSHIQRLLVRSEGLQPEILGNAPELRWVLFFVSSENQPDTRWYQELQKVVVDGLPNLQTLEFKFSGHDDSPADFARNYLTSRSRGEAIELLDELIRNPNRFGDE